MKLENHFDNIAESSRTGLFIAYNCIFSNVKTEGLVCSPSEEGNPLHDMTSPMITRSFPVQ